MIAEDPPAPPQPDAAFLPPSESSGDYGRLPLMKSSRDAAPKSTKNTYSEAVSQRGFNFSLSSLVPLVLNLMT
jgi:hypothetical protein